MYRHSGFCEYPNHSLDHISLARMRSVEREMKSARRATPVNCQFAHALGSSEEIECATLESEARATYLRPATGRPEAVSVRFDKPDKSKTSGCHRNLLVTGLGSR